MDVVFVEIVAISEQGTRIMQGALTWVDVPVVDGGFGLVAKTIRDQQQSVVNKTHKLLQGEQVELVDRFEGEQLGDNKVSQAFRLRYRGKNETLTDDKIQPVHDKVRAALSKQFQAELRS